MRKPTWVFVVGAYRTGSTTQYRIVSDVIEKTENGAGIGYHKEERLVEHDDDEERYIACKVFRYLPHESETAKRFLLQRRIRVIGTVRDPRDIFVSMQERERRSGRFADWDPKTRITKELPEWLAQFDIWASLPKDVVYISRFEDMILDLKAETLRIAQFLGIPMGGREASRISREYQIPTLKKRKKEYWDTRRKIEKDGGTAPREHAVLPSIPGVEFGTSGHWKQWLHPRQARMVLEYCSKYARRWGYK
jgi:hypothetical protein